MSQDLSQNKKQAGRRGQEAGIAQAGQNHDNTGTHIGGITDNDIDTAYQDALRWIHSSMRFGSKLGLERISSLLELLGNPQNNTKFIHVAGTNGKGSVTSIAASILKEAGFRTGMYISPYLEDYRERIMLNGRKIPKDKIVGLVGQVRHAVEQLIKEGFEHPTEFEINTALAFLYFAQEDCDYVALEVGMGGRFDATNVVTPVVSVITTIDFDHMDRLGNRLSEIAFEKAGIIKPGVPVVTGAVEEEALDVIRRRASECGSSLTVVGNAPQLTGKLPGTGCPDNGCNSTLVDGLPVAGVTWKEAPRRQLDTSGTQRDLAILDVQVVSISGPGFEYRNLHLPLLGKHQQLNAALAVAALKVAQVKHANRPHVSRMQCANQPHSSSSSSSSVLDSIALDEQAIRTGIAKAVWPGRLEVMHKDPVIILDGAHNPQGARVLAEFIKELSDRKIVCVYGILSDKCYKESTSLIAPLCDEMIVTRPQTPRALGPELLAGEVAKHTEKVFVEDDCGKALELALTRVSSRDVVLCCGSLYLVGPVRTYIRNKFGISPYGGE